MIFARGANASRGRHWRQRGEQTNRTAAPVAPAENGMEKVGGGRGEGGGRIAGTVDRACPRRIPRKIYSAETAELAWTWAELVFNGRYQWTVKLAWDYPFRSWHSRISDRRPIRYHFYSIRRELRSFSFLLLRLLRCFLIAFMRHST